MAPFAPYSKDLCRIHCKQEVIQDVHSTDTKTPHCSLPAFKINALASLGFWCLGDGYLYILCKLYSGARNNLLKGSSVYAAFCFRAESFSKT